MKLKKLLEFVYENKYILLFLLNFLDGIILSSTFFHSIFTSKLLFSH